MIEHWSADCFHVNVTFVNATTVSILCQQNTTQHNIIRLLLLIAIGVYFTVLISQNARLRKKLKEYESLQRVLLV